ncbi:hypothetical protein M0805_005647 [Coniferiporia weirii]|nr:hypothetical protein M0805_005647 [Coniferiporia weirii]
MAAAPIPRRSSRAKIEPTANGKAATTKATAKGKAPAAKAKRPMSPEPESDDDTKKQPAKRSRSVKDAATSSDEEVKAIDTALKKAELGTKKIAEKKSKATGAKGAADKTAGAKATKEKAAGAKGTAKKAARTITNPLLTPPEHTRPANQIFVWGAGNFGQFGMGPDHLGEFDKPRKNPWVEKKMDESVFGGEGAGIEAIAAGGLHTMFIDEKGTVWSCGVNDDAALGRVTKDVPDPENDGAFMNVDILTSFPYPLQSLVDDNFRAVSIAAGDSICAAISDLGELRVWGSFRANEGSLGFSGGSKYQYIPAPILNLPKDENVSSVAAGNNHLVVLTTHGNIYTWGAGEQGQLGRKIIERRKIHGTTPEKVTLKARSLKAVVVGAGNYTSYAVDEKGGVWGWGLNSMGQVGTGYEDEDDQIVPQPQLVIGLSSDELGGARITRIVGGEHHTLFLASDGRVFACGRANGGQLGLPADHAAFKAEGYEGLVAEPTLIPFPDAPADDPVVHISAGIHSNFAVTAAGALYAWGEGNQGELGIGEDTDAKTPTVIVRKEGGSWKAISAESGGQHSLGLFVKKAAKA